MPVSDLELLIDAAHAAGDIARRYFNASPEVYEKADQSPVTEADLEVDRMLRSELCANRPDYGWLSEETEDTEDRLNREHVFIVDPIDGTRAFINGEPSFSHSLAIARNGVVTAGVIYLPIMDRLYTAATDASAMMNGTEMRASDSVETLLSNGRDFKPEHWPGGLPTAKRHFRPSLAYRMALVAQGRFDAMLTLRSCNEWDIAAGALMLQKSGGIATDKSGQALRFNSPDPLTNGLIAGGKPAHRDLLTRLGV